MIRVVVTRRPTDRSILSFEVKGHAGYADPGSDIVCAGVSAITVGTVNAVEKLAGVEMDSRIRNGFLQASLPGTLDDVRHNQAQLLLESMVVMLDTIEESYGDYITIQQT